MENQSKYSFTVELIIEITHICIYISLQVQQKKVMILIPYVMVRKIIFFKDLVIVSKCTPIIYTNGLQSTMYPISSMTCA